MLIFRSLGKSIKISIYEIKIMIIQFCIYII